MKALTANAVQYRVARKIADGGMGSVYEAVQDGTDGFTKTVALKTLLPQFIEKENFVKMFISEAKLVANLVHENIVQIYQLGRSPEGYYIVMEYVNGTSLHAFLDFHRITKMQVPQPLAVFIAARIARGLAYAHSREDDAGQPLGIVHRDVCPNNVLITREGLPKLTDFGIAVATRAMQEGASKAIMGKLTYMAPEQANRQDVDFRADLFGLGAVLFEMLAGQAIRVGGEVDEQLAKARRAEVDWDALPDDLSPDLREILERCLSADPNARYPQTSDAARALEYYIYKDGYGPTIQTLEEYLRKEFPYLYRIDPAKQRDQQRLLAETTRTLPTPIDSTIVME